MSGIRSVVLALSAVAALAAVPAVAHAQHAEAEHAEGAHGGHHGLSEPDLINWADMGFKDKDIHGGTLDQGEHSMAPPLLFALFNFAVFIGLLFWKAGPPIRRWLDQRHSSIKDALSEAAALRQEAADKLASYDKRIAAVDAEVNTLISEIRSDAEAEKKRILEDAAAQAAAMERAAKERIEAEVTRARVELEREVISAAVSAAERVLRKQATAGDHRSLVKTFISDLEASQATPPTGGAKA